MSFSSRGQFPMSGNDLLPSVKPFAVLDGGLATELERRGADLRDPLWSAKLLIEDPLAIAAVHRDYLAAGADILISASYQATVSGFECRGLSRSKAENLLRLSVTLAKEERDRFWQTNPPDRVRPLVAASVGCYGAHLHDGSEYRGDYGLTVDELADWHRRRLEILVQASPDLLACETIPCLIEAEALAAALADFSRIPAWLSFSCKDETHLCAGDDFSRAVAVACDVPSVIAVGINCTAPHLIEPLLHSAHAEVRIPFIVYPNLGEAWDASAHRWVGEYSNGADWNDLANRWHAAGARIIGGCCRTTPVNIQQIARCRDSIR